MSRSPLLVDITPLKRQPGVQRAFELALDAPTEWALVTAEVQATRLDFDLQLEVAGDELITQGTIAVGWCGPCRRCLEPQTGRVGVEVREIFDKVPVEGETWALDEDQVDLEPMVRELVLLHLPVAPLCRDDCAGPDPDRFPTSVAAQADDLDGDDEVPIDPRWAALGELRFDE